MKPKTWEDEDTYGSDILGIGAYQSNKGDIGKTKTQPIGFTAKHKKNGNNKKNKVTAGRSGPRLQIPRGQR